mmetsp:Transcript_22517/g.39805  ORF Transcript_22517/g.39805 Transcript_22517/m.39805 type:complete len:206 (-) Transcript_22517:252-869(-)|eukprot:CAMPEP_0197517030 /NCGR_PEP_ID=MMETSP1318-20131121/1995_1 /TAXON_ID=552666 /ORGANISM="Partenskyella glossopodia, Strain RCC365" /LENGTH=205 /DNA_ID=CAMNT_0043066259 /DNA_START=125 /DNA_END=742 /DNA_ORIENTATION=-
MGLLNLLRSLSGLGKGKSMSDARILVLGLDNAGKTTCLKQMSNESISTVSPTQGFNIKSLVQDNFRLNVWDIGGQKVLRPYWSNYFEDTDCLVYVIDSADQKRVSEAGDQLHELLENEKLYGVPILVLANKQDLLNALKPKDIIKSLNLMKIPKSHVWMIAPCSAKTGKGLQEAIAWMIKVLNKRQQEKKEKRERKDEKKVVTAA